MSDLEVVDKFLGMNISDRTEMLSKDVLWLPDENSGSYNGQVTFDLSGFSTSQKWVNYSEAYIVMPYVISVTSSVDIGGDAAALLSNKSILTLKDGFHHLIDSVVVEVNNKTVHQSQNFTNIHSHFRIITTESVTDVLKNRFTNGVFGESVSSMSYSAVADVNGVGFTNKPSAERVSRLISINNGIIGVGGGVGYLPSMDKTDIVNNSARSYYTYDNVAAAGKTYYWVVYATIKLGDLSDVFNKLPLCKATQVKLTITYNSCNFTVTTSDYAAGPPIVPSKWVGTSYTQTSGHCNPVHLNPTTVTGNGVLTVKCNVMKTSDATSPSPAINSCRLYAPFYKVSDSLAIKMIQQYPTTSVSYNEIFQYTYSNINPQQSFSATVSTGIIDPMYIVIVPYAKTGTVGDPAVSILPGMGYQNPFSSCPATTEPIAIRDLQIIVNGQNIFQSNEHYDFENFLNEMSKINSVNGNNVMGITSGIIGKEDFYQGYRYYVADLSRRPPSEDKSPKSIIISGYNSLVASSVAAVVGPPAVPGSTFPGIIDLLCFVVYKKQISIKTATGTSVD